MGAHSTAELVRIASEESADLRIWACDLLVRDGYIDEAEQLLANLANIPEISSEAKKLLAVCRQLRRWGIIGQLERMVFRAPASTAEGDTVSDFSQDTGILLARREGAKAVIFVFTGYAKQFWVSLQMLHQLLPKAGYHIVYLKDYSDACYLGGISELGGSMRATVAGLRELARSLDATDIYCLGNSIGGYAALRYGLELEAEAVLAFSAATKLDPVLAAAIGVSDLQRYFDEDASLGADLKQLYAEATNRPRVILAYGELHANDASQAQHFADLPDVTLHPVPGYDRHEVVSQLIATGMFPGLVEGLLRIQPVGEPASLPASPLSMASSSAIGLG